jgi:hypothetical protein
VLGIAEAPNLFLSVLPLLGFAVRPDMAALCLIAGQLDM